MKKTSEFFSSFFYKKSVKFSKEKKNPFLCHLCHLCLSSFQLSQLIALQKDQKLSLKIVISLPGSRIRSSIWQQQQQRRKKSCKISHFRHCRNEPHSNSKFRRDNAEKRGEKKRVFFSFVCVCDFHCLAVPFFMIMTVVIIIMTVVCVAVCRFRYLHERWRCCSWWWWQQCKWTHTHAQSQIYCQFLSPFFSTHSAAMLNIFDGKWWGTASYRGECKMDGGSEKELLELRQFGL